MKQIILMLRPRIPADCESLEWLKIPHSKTMALPIMTPTLEYSRRLYSGTDFLALLFISPHRILIGGLEHPAPVNAAAPTAANAVRTTPHRPDRHPHHRPPPLKPPQL